MIDPGPHVKAAIKDYSVDCTKIEYILNTHRHDDHFNAEALGFLKSCGAKIIEVDSEKEFEINNYRIKAVRGNHKIDVFHYIISDGKSRMFYGLDGAWLMPGEVSAIKEKTVDFAVLDGTIGFVDGDWRIFEHNNMNMVVEMKKALTAFIKRFCISHMAYTLHDRHDILSDNMKKYGIEVACDGMTMEF